MTASNHPNSNFIAERLPNWVKALDASSLKTVGDSLLLEQTTAPGDWFDAAAPFDRRALLDRQAQRERCRQTLCALVPDFKGVMAFAEQPLRTQIQQTFGQDLDVHTTSLLYVGASTSFAGLVSHYTAVEQSLLQAALHNFDDGQVFDSNAGLVAGDGYSLEYIPHEQLQLTQPQNHGDFQLDFTELTPTADPYPLFRYNEGARLPISPAGFAQMCRELDLGQRYQDYLAETFKPAAVGDALQALREAEFAVLCQVALMQDHIDADDFAMLEACRLGHPMSHAGRPMQALRLQLLSTELHDVVVFVPSSGSTEPCIVWLPGDSQASLKRYGNSGEFMSELVMRLRQPEYLTEFLGRVHLANRVAFGQLLAQRLVDGSPSLEVTHPAWEPALFEHLHRRHLLWLSSQAQHQAVPTAAADKLATIERWQGYLDTGLNALGFAALFIPGLGPMLLPIMGAQMMNGLYHGLADLAEGDKADAWNHLAGLALNLGLMAAFHQGMKLTTEISPFTDNLLPVEGPDGVARLWNGDIRPYAAELAIDPAWRPNALGLYDVEGVEYLPLDGKLYRTRVDELTGERVITRPAQPDAYEPGLRGGVDSGWLHAGDRPARWHAHALLRRLEPRAVTLDDARLEQVLKIADIDEQALRSAVAEGGSVPFELLDTLQRAVTAQELDRVIAALANGDAVSSLHSIPVEAMVQAPTWPQDIVLKVFESSEPWGDFSEYGASELPQARRIALMRDDLPRADRLAPILKGLGEEGLTTLLGQSTSAAETQAVQLQKLLASELQTQRARLFEQWHATELARLGSTAVASDEEQLVMRQFPRLDQPLARSVVDSASIAEQPLLKEGRLPLRLAEQAHHLQRNLRLNRALLECTYAPGQSADSQRLLLAALGRQEGWGDSLRIELRSNDAPGSLIAAAGSEQAVLQRTITVDAQGFRPGDSAALRSLGEAILAVLPAAERSALGAAASDASTLETVLTERTLADRQASARALGQADAQPWFRPPLRNSRGQLGYVLSGRGPSWADPLLFPGSREYRLRELFPTLNSNARNHIVRSLQGSFETALMRLETEFQVLKDSLGVWESQAQTPGHQGVRQEISRRLVAAWRRQELPQPRAPYNANKVGIGLDLSGLQGGTLPVLVADFSHLQWLDLRNMGLAEAQLDGFLPSFKRLTNLNLSYNQLTQLPAGLPELQSLLILDLSANQLQWRTGLLAPLEETSVAVLGLSGNSLALSGEGMQALAQLKSLRELDLRDAELVLDAADIEHLAQINLRHLDLQGNQIVLSEAAAAAFSGMTEMARMRLADNPLGRSPQLANMINLRYLDLADTGLTEWPDGLTALMERTPMLLRQVRLPGNSLVEVPSLVDSAFATAPRTPYLLPLVIDDAALSAQSLVHLRQIGIEPVLANPPDWMIEAGPELRDRYRMLREEAGSANFLEAMRRATLSADYQANPAYQRQQMQRLLRDLTQQPPPIGLADLRAQLYEAADGAEATCGDGLELLFSQARNLMEVFRLATDPGLVGPHGLLPVVAYSRRLYRLELVDDYARAISNARVRRRAIIYPGAAAADAAGNLPLLTDDPALLGAADAQLLPYDRIPDVDLQIAPDEAEIRLRLRLLLADELELPYQPQSMLYEGMGFIQEATARQIRVMINQRVTAVNMLDWLMLQQYWEFALQRVYPVEFAAFDERWNAGAEAIYELGRPDPDPVVLAEEVLAVFRQTLPEQDWSSGDLAGRIRLTPADADVLRGALNHATTLAQQALARRLSEPLVQALLPAQ